MVEDPLEYDPMEDDENVIVCLPSMTTVMTKYAAPVECPTQGSLIPPLRQSSLNPGYEPRRVAPDHLGYEYPSGEYDAQRPSLPRFQVWTPDGTSRHEKLRGSSADTFLIPTRLDGTSVPLLPFRRYHVEDDDDDDEHVHKKQKRGPHAIVVTNPSSQLVYPYESIPQELRDALEPRFAHAPNTPTGFLHVALQPNGSGYQVQLWRGKKNGGLVRLGTVNDPRVGALLYAAARIDVALIQEKLLARDWLVKIMEGDPETPIPNETPSLRARAWLFMHSL